MAGHIPDSLSVDWCTPDWIIECIRELYLGQIDLDPCSNPHSRVNATEQFMLSDGKDGLIIPWNARNIYVNPPFGKGWYKPVHRPDCTSQVTADVASCCRSREYFWPGDRTKAEETMSKADYKAWVNGLTAVSVGTWIERCAVYGGSENVVGLIPAYPGTKAFQNHIWKRAQAVFFPEGRLHFRLVYVQPDGSTVEKTGPAPMDCCLPLWTPHKDIVDRFGEVFSKHGHVQLL